MKIQSGRTLDRLCCEQSCLGAVFASYSFDPAFFEDQVLRAVFRLGSDPVEQPQRYYAEALRALQETPTAVIVDAGQRRPGRRLPYDVLEVNDVVFHPKSVLLLFEKHAVLMVGSGNLTSPGYSENTELFLTLDLHYDNEHESRLLREFDQHLVRTSSLARQSGSQLSLVREELQRRIESTKSHTGLASFSLLDSISGPLIDQISKLLPSGAEIDRLGMLAPFYERDDGGELDSSSVFGALKSRLASKVSLDVAVAWDNAQVRHEIGQVTIDEGLNHLWGWTSGDKENCEVEYLVPTAIGPSTLQYIDCRGESRRSDLQEAVDAADEGEFWMLPKPIAFAPRKSLKAATKDYSEVRLWLHPATQLSSGRPVHRPLHAKLLLIGFRDGEASRTLVVMGSANMSRRALLERAGSGGNVELGLAFVLDDTIALSDFLPELVSVPAKLLDLKEREFPDLGTNWSEAIVDAVHDPAKRTLLVSWSARAAELPTWRLLYHDQALAASEVPPESSIKVEAFVLQPATAEVVLQVDDKDFSIPILVNDLVALPAIVAGNNLGLNDLLLLLGCRIGTEQAINRAKRRSTDDPTDLDRFFGAEFTPTDVFRAWWTVANDLHDPSLSVMAFRLLLEGSLGAGFAWKCMINAACENTMDATEVWFYGAELLRELDQLELLDAPDRDVKRELLDSFKLRVHSDLKSIAPEGADVKWVDTIRGFYLGAKK